MIWAWQFHLTGASLQQFALTPENPQSPRSPGAYGQVPPAANQCSAHRLHSQIEKILCRRGSPYFLHRWGKNDQKNCRKSAEKMLNTLILKVSYSFIMFHDVSQNMLLLKVDVAPQALDLLQLLRKCLRWRWLLDVSKSGKLHRCLGNFRSRKNLLVGDALYNIDQ